MGKKLPPDQRIVKSVENRQKYKYEHTSAKGTAQRTKAAVRYIDKHEQNQLYTVDEQGKLRETDREEAAQRIDDTESKYNQHVVFTTTLDPEKTYVDQEEYAQMVAESVQKIRPDANIYAVSVHTDTDELHAHVSFGTDTVVRHQQGRNGELSDLEKFRKEAYTHEERIREHGHDRELTQEELKPLREKEQQREQRQHIRQQQQDFHNEQERER